MSAFDFDVSAFAVGLAAQLDATEDAIEARLQRYAAEAEAWMKANRRWTDRTNAARQGLYTLVDHEGKGYVLWFSHGANVPYGIWLEIANEGRYAIIGPALDHFFPRIMRDVQFLLLGQPQRVRGIARGVTRPGGGIFKIRGVV